MILFKFFLVFFCASHSGSDIQDVNTAIAEGKNAVENNSLLGDWFREKHKNSVEYWKTEIREKIGENTASQILNGIMISYGDTVDFGAGTADTALDAILALGSCTMGMSYCDTALNDLKKADKTVSDAMTSLINGDTWDHVRDVFAKAQKGDQQSLEEVASILTSVLVPSKLAGNAGKVVNKIDNVVPPKAGKGTAGKISPENQKYVDILSPEAKQHILYGDSLTSGGHLYPGNPGKTIFPKEWSADKIVHEIGDIATSPSTQWYAQTGTGGIYTAKGKPANWVSYEVRDGVRIRVVYQPATGKIITAFPDNAPVPNSYKPIK